MADPLYVRSLGDFYSLAGLYTREGDDVAAAQGRFGAYGFDAGAFGDPNAADSYATTHAQVITGLQNLADSLVNFGTAVQRAGDLLFDTDASLGGH